MHKKDINMSNGWKIGVIDKDLTDFSKFPEFERFLDKCIARGPVNNGDICAIMTTSYLPYDNVVAPMELLRRKPRYESGIPMATCWFPRLQTYRRVMLDMLRPIITMQDAIDVELKFGISLKDYI